LKAGGEKEMKTLDENEVEELAAIIHDLYLKEAGRQGSVIHEGRYKELPEDMKEFDRVIARYVLQNFHRSKARVEKK